jgi:hypothetical protein
MDQLRIDFTIRAGRVMNHLAPQDLADEIQKYWRSRGHGTVKVWCEPAFAPDATPIVCSNLVAGLPPGVTYRRGVRT